jgi:hypothetical protein
MKLVYEQDADPDGTGICRFIDFRYGKTVCWLDVERTDCHGYLANRPDNCRLVEVKDEV